MLIAMNKKIHFIITGGTIDSFYDPRVESGSPLKKSVIPDFIKDSINPQRRVSFKTVCMKDSGDLTSANRQAILKSVLTTKSNSIVITHGTVTMEITAEFLKNKLPPDHKKTIVLTGAMTPLKQFAMSDGGFNLGYAMASALSEKPGVYICMHGQIFSAGAVKKNRKLAKFETKKT